MKKTFFLFFMLAYASNILAIEISADLFTCDEAKIEKDFEELNKLEAFLVANPEMMDIDNLQNCSDTSYYESLKYQFPNNQLNIAAPGKIPSFLFTFILSGLGTYTIYGAVAGPISVGIVYFSTKKDKKEVRKAIWGCATGTLVGAGIKYAVVNL